MRLEPSAVVLYVDHLAISSQFYQDLLGLEPEEASSTFHSFRLSNGMGFGLKVKHTVEPTSEPNGSGELAFIMDTNRKVDDIFIEWQDKKISILVPPAIVDYGYTFVAADPDGNRLRVVSIGKS